MPSLIKKLSEEEFGKFKNILKEIIGKERCYMPNFDKFMVSLLEEKEKEMMEKEKEMIEKEKEIRGKAKSSFGWMCVGVQNGYEEYAEVFKDGTPLPLTDKKERIDVYRDEIIRNTKFFPDYFGDLEQEGQ